MVTANVALASQNATFPQRLAMLGRLEEKGGTLEASAFGRKQFVVPIDAAGANQYGGFNRGAVRRLLN